MDAKLNFNFIFHWNPEWWEHPPKRKNTRYGQNCPKKNGQSLLFFWGHQADEGDLKKITLIGGHMAECPSQACVVGGVENPKKIEFSR